MVKGISRSEKFIASILILVATLLLAISNWVRWYYGGADNVFLVQLANNIAHTGYPYSQVSAAVKNLFEFILGQPFDVVCNLNLHFPEAKEFNYFKWHTYFFLYLLSPIHRVIDARHVLPVLTAISFVGLLAFVYFYLRSKSIPVLLSIIFLILIYIHPAWNQGVMGQVYSDRFYLLFGVPFLYLLSERPDKHFLILLLGLLIASISERFGAIIGIQTLYFAFLPILKKQYPNLKLLLLGVLFCTLSLIILRFYSEYGANKSFASSLTLPGFLSNYSSEIFRANLKTFILITCIGLGSFSLFKPTLLPLLLVNIYPNAIGNLGGAEKTGFLTHYHASYFPVLVFASLQGFIVCYRYVAGFSSWKPRMVLTTFAMVVGSLNMYVSLTYLPGFNSGPNFYSAYFAPFGRIQSFFDGSHEYFKENILTVSADIPAGSRVVTTEFGLPILGLQNEVAIVPLGLANADYAFLPVIQEGYEGKKFMFGGSCSYLGVDDNNKQNDCINEHLRDYGYDLDDIRRYGSWALITRRK